MNYENLFKLRFMIGTVVKQKYALRLYTHNLHCQSVRHETFLMAHPT